MSTTRPYPPGDRGRMRASAALRGGQRRRVRAPGRPSGPSAQPRRRERGRPPRPRFRPPGAARVGLAARRDRRSAGRRRGRTAGRLRARHQRLPARRGPGRAVDRLRQQSAARRGLRPGHRPARPAHPAPRRAPRRSRDVHRAAAVPGLGGCPGSRGRGQDRMGGTRGARLVRSNPHQGLPQVRTLLRTRRIDRDPARPLSSLHKAPGVP